MNGQYDQIQQELLETKKELVDRLNQRDVRYEQSIGNVYNSVANLYEEEKNSILHFHLREELDDVNRALIKLDLGLYGICEHSGEKIPADQLKVLPTARTIEEASLTNKFNYYKQTVLVNTL